VYERSGALGMVLRLANADGTATAVSFAAYVRASGDGGATGAVESEVLNLANLLDIQRRMEALWEMGLRIVGSAS
ncbi:MAG TPA: hypothetical protein PKE04_07305, partial [Clostridia bacterium]|nr:hypothetical protein [Clostridia bacterium]